MKQNINDALKLQSDFEYAINSLNKKGKIKTTTLSNEKYRVEIKIEDTVYFEEGDDTKLATIRLSNQFN